MTLTKRTLAAMSDALELAAGAAPVTAVALFQRREHFSRKRHRWTRLARDANGLPVDIGYVGASVADMPPGATSIPIGPDDDLADQWLLLLANADVCGALEAVDLHRRSEREAGAQSGRLFRSCWTVEPGRVAALCDHFADAHPKLATARTVAATVRRPRRSPAATTTTAAIGRLLEELASRDEEAVEALDHRSLDGD